MYKEKAENVRNRFTKTKQPFSYWEMYWIIEIIYWLIEQHVCHWEKFDAMLQTPNTRYKRQL